MFSKCGASSTGTLNGCIDRSWKNSGKIVSKFIDEL